MYRPLILMISLRYALSRKSDNFGRFVSILSMFGILLGTMGLVIVLSVMNGLEHQMAQRTLLYYPQLQIQAQDHPISMNEYPKSQIEHYFKHNFKHNEVLEIVPLIASEVIVQSPSGLALVELLGVNPEAYDPIIETISTTARNDLQEKPYQVVIGYDLAQSMGVTLGDTLRITLPDVTTSTPMGYLPMQRLFTVAGIYSINRDVNQSLIYVNIADAQKLMRFNSDTIGSWRLFVRDPLRISEWENIALPSPLIYKDWREKKGALFSAIKMEKKIMGLLISLIIVVAIFNIITSLSLLIMEKTREIAILKTVGLRFHSLLLIFILQGGLIAFVGSFLGLVLGTIVATHLPWISDILSLNIQLPTQIEPQQMVWLFLFLVITTLLSTLYPAYKAAKTDPAEALRYE